MRVLGRDCVAGYARVGTSCVMCGGGKYRVAVRRNDSEPETNCTDCTNCTAIGKYQTRACFYALDTTCGNCTQRCAVGQYKASPCGGTQDLRCAACASSCPPDFYLGSPAACPGTTDFDTVRAGCLPCINASLCPPGQIVKRRCNGTEMATPQCEACTRVAGGCLRDEYMGGCREYQDYACLPFTRCPSGQYLINSSAYSDGVCVACSTPCEQRGLQTVVACSTYADALCGGQLCREDMPCPPPPDGGAIYCRYFNHTVGVCAFCPVRPGCFVFVRARVTRIPPGGRKGTRPTDWSATPARAGSRATVAGPWWCRASVLPGTCPTAARATATCSAMRRAPPPLPPRS